jgi:hypothetical protein
MNDIIPLLLEVCESEEAVASAGDFETAYASKVILNDGSIQLVGIVYTEDGAAWGVERSETPEEAFYAVVSELNEFDI